MQKPLLAVILYSLAAPAAYAQALADASASPHTFSANVSLVNDYRFRGYTQTNLRPAIQGGFDYAHASGFYVGNWNSNVTGDLFPGGNLEMDFYGGYARAFGDVNVDVGLLYYTYPGSRGPKGGTIDHTEVYLGLAYGPFSAKYSHGVSDFFGIPDSRNTYYLEAAADFDLGNGWGLGAHVGYQKLRNDAYKGYIDYAVGVTKDIHGWELGAKVVTTNKPDWYQTSQGRDAGRTGIVVSLARAF